MSELGEARHRARERALEITYEAAMKDRPVEVIVGELTLAPDGYTTALLAAFASAQPRANELIRTNAVDWPLERLAVVDRLIMTLAVGEMLMDSPPPLAVILDEAVELAKVFSTDGSSSFVNGVLSAIAQKVSE